MTQRCVQPSFCKKEEVRLCFHTAPHVVIGGLMNVSLTWRTRGVCRICAGQEGGNTKSLRSVFQFGFIAAKSNELWHFTQQKQES